MLDVAKDPLSSILVALIPYQKASSYLDAILMGVVMLGKVPVAKDPQHSNQKEEAHCQMAMPFQAAIQLVVSLVVSMTGHNHPMCFQAMDPLISIPWEADPYLQATDFLVSSQQAVDRNHDRNQRLDL